MKKHLVFWVAAGVVIILWANSYFILTSLFGGPPKEVGVAGDLFGAINALFSGLGLAGIIYTFVMQREQIDLQREEMKKLEDASKVQIKLQEDQLEAQATSAAQQLEMQRQQLEAQQVALEKQIEMQKEQLQVQTDDAARSRTVLDEQSATMKVQRFESTFFHLVSRHNEIIKLVTFEDQSVLYTERKAMEKAISQLNNELYAADLKEREKGLTLRRDVIYQNVLNKVVNLEFYIGNFYFVLDHIREEFKDEPIRDKYSRIFFSQLSREQISIVVLYGSLMSMTGGENLAEQYKVQDLYVSKR
ncbi:hypothetical protein [Paenibacillus xanthanilyticus]|uniref:Uncharacterized protein n=1 Tax=Paenibacillus xanthanilyticus TaxID=1783531 RepID=A0ABV8KA99_9BACL